MIDLIVRVVLDTNIWISAFINPDGPPARILSLALRGDIVLVWSDYLIDEIREVVQRPRILRRLHVSPAGVERIIEQMRAHAVHVATPGTLLVCRDADDNAILETAIEGSAHYLVSRDDDIKRDPELVAHLAASGIRVISVARFLDILDAEQG